MDETNPLGEAEVKQRKYTRNHEGETEEQKAKRLASNAAAKLRNAARRAAKRGEVGGKVVEADKDVVEVIKDALPDAEVVEGADEVKKLIKKVALSGRRAGKTREQGEAFAQALRRRGAHDDRKVNNFVRDAAHGVQTVLHGAIPASTLQWLQKEADALVNEFLGKQFDVPLPVIAVSIDKLNKKRLAQYHPDRDGMGLRWRVDVNYRSLGSSQLVVVATLLHEIMHAVQNDHGLPGHKNFHNNEFQAWCWWLGIPTDEGGHFLGVYEHSLFWEYAKERGIDGDCPVVEEHQKIPKAPGSPLKKWTCGCGTNARVATMFDATCNLCNTKFELQEAAK